MESVIATREEVLNFLSVPTLIDISNSGDIYGDSGYGSDYAFGDGTEHGYGYGEGNHHDYKRGGNGCGDIYGYGYDHAEGCGCGWGFIYGNGDGYMIDIEGTTDKDIKVLNGNLVDYVDKLPTIITQVHGNIACGYIIESDLTLSPCFIARVGNCFAHGYTLKGAIADAERKALTSTPIEVRVVKFIESFGTIDSEHTGKKFYEWHHILTGSCKMGRDTFCKANNVDLEKMYSVRYFLDITKESYGSDVINLLRKAYRIDE